MADYDNDYGYYDEPETSDYEQGLRNDGAERAGREPKMPPRNILETDSAKYTAEYIKEVVKGLYTVNPEMQSGSGYETDGDEDGRGHNVPTEMEPRSEPRSSGRTNPRQAVRQDSQELKFVRPERYERVERAEKADRPARIERADRTERPYRIEKPDREERAEREPEYAGTARRAEPAVEARRERPPEQWQEHQPEKRPEWRSEWKTERPGQRRAERLEFDTEPDVRIDRRREKRQEPEYAPEPAAEPGYDEQREAAERSREIPAQRSKVQSNAVQTEEEFTPDAFLKSFEKKAFGEKIDYNPGRPRERKTFSSLRADSNTAELEGALSGRPARKVSADRAEKQSAERNEPPAREREQFPTPPEQEEYVYLKQVYEDTGREQPERREAPAKRVGAGEEKIPIIINKNIEGRGMKTADDYRNISKSGYDKPLKKMEPVETRQRGANVFAAIIAIVAIVIIGFLVWRMNALSNELETVQDNADEVVRLNGQVRSLTQTNGELNTEIDNLNVQIKDLENENLRLAGLLNEYQPEEPDEETGEQAAQVNSELEDGYYTVKSGDTLWKISEKFLGSGEEYMKIAQANNMEPSQPLYAGLKLKIPGQ